MNPVDEKSMNGNYPGKPTGTRRSERLTLLRASDPESRRGGGPAQRRYRREPAPLLLLDAVGERRARFGRPDPGQGDGLDHIIVRDVDLTNAASTRSASATHSRLARWYWWPKLGAGADRRRRCARAGGRLLNVLASLGCCQGQAGAAAHHLAWKRRSRTG